MGSLIDLLRDWLLTIRIYFGHKYMYDEQRKVVRIWPNRLVKGPVHQSDYDALTYVANQTTVPVPRVHHVYHRKDGLYIERDFIEGRTLDTLWNDLSPQVRKQYVEQVWRQLGELRAHTPPSPLDSVVAASISGGPLFDGALNNEPIGPFNRSDSFEDVIRNSPNTFALPVGWDNDKALRKIVLTNGDIAPRNIVVRQKGQPSSMCIVDWEFAGWRPAYWERVKWHFADFPPGELEGWVEMMDEVSCTPISSDK